MPIQTESETHEKTRLFLCCNIPKNFKYKNSSCIHGILHIMVFSKTLNLIPSKNIVSNAILPQIFRNKKVSERKFLK
jgi:hypothetical protein